MFTAEQLRMAVEYNPETGKFKRLVASSHAKAGGNFGSPNGSGYLRACVYGKKNFLHRLAFLYMTGEWPKNCVDHINGDRADNRWVNLRDVTTMENIQNRLRATRSSVTGVLGVTKRRGKFLPQLMVNYKRVRLGGPCDTLEEAQAIYLEARRKLHKGNTL